MQINVWFVQKSLTGRYFHFWPSGGPRFRSGGMNFSQGGTVSTPYHHPVAMYAGGVDGCWVLGRVGWDVGFPAKVWTLDPPHPSPPTPSHTPHMSPVFQFCYTYTSHCCLSKCLLERHIEPAPEPYLLHPAVAVQKASFLSKTEYLLSYWLLSTIFNVLEVSMHMVSNACNIIEWIKWQELTNFLYWHFEENCPK
jgi:hypothetical protein